MHLADGDCARPQPANGAVREADLQRSVILKKATWHTRSKICAYLRDRLTDYVSPHVQHMDACVGEHRAVSSLFRIIAPTNAWIVGVV